MRGGKKKKKERLPLRAPWRLPAEFDEVKEGVVWSDSDSD